MPNGIGIEQVILAAQDVVFNGQQGAAAHKISARGYLGYLLNQSRPQILSKLIDPGDGYIRNVQVQLEQRVGLGTTVTTDDCSIQAVPSYLTRTLPSLLFRKKAIFFDQDLISTFSTPALDIVNLPNSNPEAKAIQKVIMEFKKHINGMMGDIDKDCLQLQLAAFGVNAATGTNAARTMNIPLRNYETNLSEGWPMLLNDATMNEIMPDSSDMFIVGGGLINNYYLNQGYNPLVSPGDPRFYLDPLTQSVWGANQFAVLQRDAVQFINVCMFRGPKAGEHGKSIFGTLRWPIQDFLGNTEMSNFEFDFQIRYNDCPTTLVINGVSTPVGRGWIVDLMARYRPVWLQDQYATGDPLAGNNGTYRYALTNVDNTTVPDPQTP